MGINDRPDNQIVGQMGIEDLFQTEPQRLFAVSRIFARARKNMTLAEQKTLVFALSEIKFKEPAKSNVIYIDKKALAEVIGVKADPDHLSVEVFNRIKELPKHSFIEIKKEDKGLFDSGTFITRVTMLKNRVRVKFEEEYLSLFSNLSTNFITMWSSDIFQMSSIRSVQFYEHLRQITDTRKQVNDVLLGVRALKEMFNIPETGEGSYMRKSGFNRTAFEERVVQPLCDDMNKCSMIKLVVQPDGKYYEKVKEGSRVIGYRFYWTFSAYPAVASASEVHELQERVDQDPVVLKVAKDIVKGEKKQKAKKETNDFNERTYDYADLERKLMEKK